MDYFTFINPKGSRNKTFMTVTIKLLNDVKPAHHCRGEISRVWHIYAKSSKQHSSIVYLLSFY